MVIELKVVCSIISSYDDIGDRKPIWDGRLRIVSRDNKLFILLEHTRGDEAGELFASCPIQADPKLPPSVEYVVDSSRYFVLRIEGDKGKKAYLGLFFNSREEAFDFKAGLQHEQKYFCFKNV